MIPLAIDVETWDEARFLAQLDYDLKLGCTFEVDYVSFYVGDTQHEVNDLVRVRLNKTDRNSLLHENDEYLDPYWDVSFMDPISSTGGWTDGPSYRVLEDVSGHRMLAKGSK